MGYRRAIEETLRRVVEVEAENPALAVCMAEDGYNREEHVLTDNDFIGVNITLAPVSIIVRHTSLCLPLRT